MQSSGDLGHLYSFSSHSVVLIDTDLEGQFASSDLKQFDKKLE
jgi:hypothetical protein